MCSKSTAFTRFASVVSGATSSRLALLVATVFLILPGTALAVQGYTFLNVATTGLDTSEFIGANGVIDVTHVHPAGSQGANDNDNTFADQSQFATLFPGTGLVQGHIGQTIYNHTSKYIFDFTSTGYTLTGRTIFGMWNTTDEVTAPPGGPPVYRIQLLNSNNNEVNPTTFTLVGNDDNTGPDGVLGDHDMVLIPSTGEVTFGAPINGGAGTHTNAAFWTKIPTGTKQIIVYADLPPLNTIGDGVGYYFAEVPEPTSLVLCAFGMVSLGIFGGRRRR
jgi:hypothetical protein